MKILFLLNEGFDTPGPSNHLIQTLIQDVLEKGHAVHLIESRRKRINEDIPEALKIFKDLSYDVIDRKIVDKSDFVKRYFEEIQYAFKCKKYWEKLNDIDVVFVQSCPTVMFPILLCKRHLKKPVVYSVQDMFPGSAVNSGVIKNQFIASVFYKLQKIAYKRSDAITVISSDMKRKVIEQGIPYNKIYTIVNWFDDRTVHEVDWLENRFVKKNELYKDNFYVQYAGTMGYVFDYKMVLKVAELLRPYKNIFFHMIGQGSQKDDFIKEKEELQLDNIIFFPLEPQNMVSDVYSSCSVCLIPLKKGIIGNSVPSKAGLLMACNRAIVNSVDENSDYYKMFNENEIGISASNDNPQDVADAILKLYNNKNTRDMYAKNGQDFGEAYYSRSVNTMKFIELFEKLGAEKV